MKTREAFLQALLTYQSSYSVESDYREQFIALLDHPRCYHRDHLPGHITGSAWIVDETKQFVLLTHHAKLNRWLQPGGHADGEENISGVALREAQEETGLKSITPITQHFFDLDIHPIPKRSDFPEHFHYDVRFLFQAAKEEKLQISEESHDLAWISIHDLPQVTQNNLSMLRMAEKTSRLF